MTEDKRSEVNRRYGSGTRNGQERRDETSEEWKYFEKRTHEDRRADQRRQTPDRRHVDS